MWWPQSLHFTAVATEKLTPKIQDWQEAQRPNLCVLVNNILNNSNYCLNLRNCFIFLVELIRWLESGLVYFAVHPLECEIDLADCHGKLFDCWFLCGDASEGEGREGVGVDGGKRVRVENWSFQVVQQLIMDLFKGKLLESNYLCLKQHVFKG